MANRERIFSALRAALIHFGGSVVLGGFSAGLVLGLWYPAQYGILAGGLFLWGLITTVDVICGPLLTLVVFDPRKSRRELRRDIGFIVLLQLITLAYGLYSASQARPIYLAYEGNRFRVVSMADIDPSKLFNALPELGVPGYTGPRLIGVKLVDASDPEYRESIILSVAGLPPAFRPERWTSYQSSLPQLQAALLPISSLKSKHADAAVAIDAALLREGLNEEAAGYLPLDAAKADSLDWVVIVERASGQPKTFLPLDGW